MQFTQTIPENALKICYDRADETVPLMYDDKVIGDVLVKWQENIMCINIHNKEAVIFFTSLKGPARVSIMDTPIHEQSKEYCKHCNKFVYYTIIDEEVNGYDYWWNKCTECGKHIHVFPCWSYIAAHSCSICRGIADELALERELEEE